MFCMFFVSHGPTWSILVRSEKRPYALPDAKIRRWRFDGKGGLLKSNQLYPIRVESAEQRQLSRATR